MINFQALHYKGNVLMHTFGTDFNWENANMYYKNLDKLINYVNSNKDQFNMEIFYSTPSLYVEELNK